MQGGKTNHVYAGVPVEPARAASMDVHVDLELDLILDVTRMVLQKTEHLDIITPYGSLVKRG